MYKKAPSYKKHHLHKIKHHHHIIRHHLLRNKAATCVAFQNIEITLHAIQSSVNLIL